MSLVYAFAFFTNFFSSFSLLWSSFFFFLKWCCPTMFFSVALESLPIARFHARATSHPRRAEFSLHTLLEIKGIIFIISTPAFRQQIYYWTISSGRLLNARMIELSRPQSHVSCDPHFTAPSLLSKQPRACGPFIVSSLSLFPNNLFKTLPIFSWWMGASAQDFPTSFQFSWVVVVYLSR